MVMNGIATYQHRLESTSELSNSGQVIPVTKVSYIWYTEESKERFKRYCEKFNFFTGILFFSPIVYLLSHRANMMRSVWSSSDQQRVNFSLIWMQSKVAKIWPENPRWQKYNRSSDQQGVNFSLGCIWQLWRWQASLKKTWSHYGL